MADEQLGFDLGAPAQAERSLFDPVAIRAEALALIAEARAMTTPDGPWDAAKLSFRRMLFPHLVSWIPDADERDQLCFAFTREADRIEQLLAA